MSRAVKSMFLEYCDAHVSAAAANAGMPECSASLNTIGSTTPYVCGEVPPMVDARAHIPSSLDGTVTRDEPFCA
jgi:hypothetical protein